MLGLLLLYFIGKYFYRLAGRYEKKKWLFAVLGVATYYISGLFFGLVAGVFIGYFAPEMMAQIPDYAYELISVPIGLLGCWGVYEFLKSQWSEKEAMTDPLLLDDIDQ